MRITRNKIRKIREQLGETQEAFALRFGGRTATVADWERGQCKPRPMAVRELIKLYKTYVLREQ